MSEDTVVILSNLGGPRDLTELEGFLLSLIGDPYVIQLNTVLLNPIYYALSLGGRRQPDLWWDPDSWPWRDVQPKLARKIVAKRLDESRELYRDIGGGSPLVAITERQAQLLEEASGFRTLVHMRHSYPGIEALRRRIGSPRRAIVLPLYPQYSTTTTLSGLRQLRDFFRVELPSCEVREIRSFPEHPKFVAAWQERIRTKLRQSDRPARILFSAHGIPESYVYSGDTYLGELKASVAAIMRGFPELTHELSFQSKFGPDFIKWLSPSTEEVLERLPEGERVIVVPISFVSDHVETIQEIGIQFQAVAKRKGVQMVRTPGLNTSATFIDCLKDLVRAAAA